MDVDSLIALDMFCTQYNIEFSLIKAINESGLIEITTDNGKAYITGQQLSKLEQIIRLHLELDINLEGIEAIGHLLARINKMEAKILSLQNRLRLYEG